MRVLLKLLPYFRRHRKTFFLGFGAILISTVFTVAAPILIRHAIDGLQEDITSGGLSGYAALVVAVAAVSGVFLYMQRQTIIVASRRFEKEIRNDFFRHVEFLAVRFFQNTPTGDMMAYSTNDISAVRMFFGPAVMYSTETVISFIIILVLLIDIHPILTLLALIPLPFVSYAMHRLGSSIHKRFLRIQEHFSILTTRAQENLAGIRVVKSYQRESYEIERFNALSQEYLVKNMEMARIQSLLMPLLMGLIGLSVIVVLWYGGMEVIDGVLTLGALTQFMIYISMLIWPMIAIGWVVSLIQRAAASMKRLQYIFEQVPEIADGPQTDHSVASLRGRVTFERVGFSYKADVPVLSSISFEIPEGKTYAIIGPTGCGKSSLVNLIPRLFDVTEGTLRIDGYDVRTVPLEVLRRHIAFVTQETFLFSSTLRENIMYGTDDATMEDVERAAHVARLDKDVVDFPKQYETMLGERGITLSGGQKQRVSIARAVLRNPTILILDDALSAVDTHTEEEILENLKGIMRERTSIIISHRVSTIKHADRILVLKDGGIVEAGTHEELVALGGLYADMHIKQLLTQELEEMA